MAIVRVHAKRPGGFRRAGRLWTEAPAVVDIDDATLKALRAEPMLDVREAREDDLSAAEPSVLPTVGSLEAECDALRVQLAESRAAHAADAEALRASVAHVESLEETIAGLRGPCDGCAASMDAMVKATAECDALRKQIAALEEAATAPPTKSRK